MDSDQIGQVIYLVMLGAAIGGSLVMQGRHNLNRFAQQLVIWALLFLGLLACYGLWTDISGTTAPREAVIGPAGQIEIPRGYDGHYHVTLTIEGKPVRFTVDTGASDIVLSRKDARKIGIDTERLAYLGRAFTANGTVRTASVRLRDVRLGPVTDRSVRADVNGGDMTGSLLGMSYLNRFGKIEISGGKMVLTR